MQKKTLTNAQRTQIDNFLKGYNTNRRLLHIEKYEKEFFNGGRFPPEKDGMPSETPLSRARMFEIRHFILSLGNCDEKLLLYYHYVKGDPIERCAELLGVSRRTAFRMKSRALYIAYKHAESMPEYEYFFGEA